MNYGDLNFYTVGEVAEKLRVTEHIIMTIIKDKFLEAVVLGDTGIWIVEEKAILNMLKEGSNMNEKNNVVSVEEVIKEEVVVNGEGNDERYCEDEVELEEVIEIENTLVDRALTVWEGDGVIHNEGHCKVDHKDINEENVIAEFIFDEEQAKKPITCEMVFVENKEEHEHICDDQEVNEELLRMSNKGNGV